MDSLIPIINQLQDVCNRATIKLKIDLPQIVVVGNQSSGKSSVIESIVKREFLPRGKGIVTRRPLVIRLVKVNDRDKNESLLFANNSPEVAIFNHTDKVFTDFDKVREEIEDETDRLCGNNSNISAEEIVLTVYSKNVVNLTLVDLPGFTKNPVGDQPKDIETQIRNLVTTYIENPKSIILAVSPANVDFACSESIQIANQFDPDGLRTLGVLTKLDIMDPGTDPLDVLSNKLIKIKLGIIGVVNRTQKDIDNRKPIEQALEDEKEWFSKNYPNLLSRNGQVYLANRLSELLKVHIKNCMPGVRLQIESSLSKQNEQKKLFGEDVTDKSLSLIDLIQKFTKAYCGHEPGIKTDELIGGARIKDIFHDSFARALTKLKPLENMSTDEIMIASKNCAGLDSDIVVPKVFEDLTIRELRRMEEPSLDCVDQVHEEMARFIKCCGQDVRLDLDRFPRLFRRIELIMRELLDERLAITREAVSKLVRQCLAYIDTEHPQLATNEDAETDEVDEDDEDDEDDEVVQQIRKPTSTTKIISHSNGHMTERCVEQTTEEEEQITPRQERELKRCEDIRKRIEKYFDIVRNELEVFVPRAIVLDMINNVQENLHKILTRELYKEELLDELLTECNDIATRRKECNDTIASLKEALKIINRISI